MKIEDRFIGVLNNGETVEITNTLFTGAVSDSYVMTPQLRWVERAGDLVLQQAWQGQSTGELAWHDVPMGVEG